MPTTSNFGWTTPADTDLVKDGAAAIRTLGNGIDTSLLDLKGGTTGQNLRKASNTDLDFTFAGDATNTVVDAAGDLLYGTAADTLGRLAIGTAGQFLKVNSGATAPEWASSAGGMTLISTTPLTGSSVTLTSIPGTYRSLYFYINGVTITSGANYNLIWEPNGTAGVGRYGSVSHSATTTYTDGASTQLRGSIYETIDGASANNVWILNIYEYASSTRYKAIDFCGGYKGASTNNAGIAGGWWPDNTAITSFKISTSVSTFNAGSISLYGVQ